MRCVAIAPRSAFRPQLDRVVSGPLVIGKTFSLVALLVLASLSRPAAGTPLTSAAPSSVTAPLSAGIPDATGGIILVFGDASGVLRAQRMDATGATRWPVSGVLVSSVGASPRDAAVAPDGTGGVIVTWLDARTGSLHVYAQRISSEGVPVWDPAGVALNKAPSGEPDIAGDGSGGAFIAWSDSRGETGSDVYAQHLSSTGAAMWAANGVALAATASGETRPKVQADDSGGAIVVWNTSALGPRSVLAQRVNACGEFVWAPGGVSILAGAGVWRMTTDAAGGVIACCVGDSGNRFVAQRVTSSGQTPWGENGSVLAQFELFVTWGLFPEIAPDGQGGAIVAWYGGTQALGTSDVYAARVNAAGVSQWAANGLFIGPAGSSADPLIAPDDAGGAIIAWMVATDVYAQRVNAGGVKQWLAGGVPVCTAGDIQALLALVPDGAGGAMVGWADFRHRNAGYDVYAQRLEPDGAALWRPNGAPVYLSNIGQSAPTIVADGAGGALAAWMEEVDGIYQIRAQRRDALGQPRGAVQVLCGVESGKRGPFAVSDGAGGAIVAWSDGRAGDAPDIYVQRLDSSGVVRWTNDGVRVPSRSELAGPSALCADGEGGVFIAYTTDTVRAQHVDSNGALQWGTRGVVVSSAPQSILMGPSFPCVAPDGQGGAFVAWADGRSYQDHCISGCGTAIFAQRVSGAGDALWTMNGVLLRSPIKGAYGVPEIASDGNLGAFVVWEDTRNGLPRSLYGQHLDASGALGWTVDGMTLCPTGTASHPALVASGPGSAILVWADSRSGEGLDLYAQHIGYPGPGLWSPNGVPLCVAPGDPSGPALVPDGFGGAIAVWEDSRDDPALDVYAQRIDADGLPQWSALGSVVSSGPGAQTAPAIAPAPEGGAVVAWEDSRGGSAPSIGFQRLSGTGGWLWDPQPAVSTDRPPAHSILALAGVRPNPAKGGFAVSFTLPDGGPATLEILDPAGRRMKSFDVGGRGPGTHGVTLGPEGLPPGFYFVRLVHTSGTRATKAIVMP